MAKVVLRVRLVSGDHLDVTCDDPDRGQDDLVEHALSVLAQDDGALRCEAGDRPVMVYSRGVAAVEVSPRGTIL